MSPAPPLFSVVSAVYNVAKYLPDYIRAMESQDFDMDRVEFVMVDDGSTDDSLALLEEWARRSDARVTVLRQSNAGQSAARNAGLDVATGEWVTFTDPDDWLESDYFRVVAEGLGAHPSASLVGTNLIVYQEAEGRFEDRHPKRWMFRPGDHLVDLDRFSEYFPSSAPSAFFRRDVIEAEGLRFDTRVKPVFEDGHFCDLYLLAAPNRHMLFLQSARYLYRKRADNSSTLQGAWLDPRRYTDVPRYGYLGVIAAAREKQGAVPAWIQNQILYDLSWYFSYDASNGGQTAAVGEVGREFVGLLRQVREHLDDDVIAAFRVRALRPEWRTILRHGLRTRPFHVPWAVIERWDEEAGLARVAVRFVGEEPEIVFRHRGRPVEPDATKVRAHDYFGQTLLRERIAWVPAAGTLDVLVDGRRVPLRFGWRSEPRFSVRPSYLQRRFGQADPLASSRSQRRDPQPPLEHRLLRAVASTRLARWLFEGAWVFMDRIADANDNAEILFRYARKHHRNDINAWFVVARGTPDWRRLRGEGFLRLVPHGSWVWKVLMFHAEVLVSSHVDAGVVNPYPLRGLMEPHWRYAFLQHGVTKDDISRWLNPKPIDVMVTSTTEEHEAFVADGSPYVHTSREAHQTGMPRFDALLAAAEEMDGREPSRILLAPTWRDWLNAPLEPGMVRREIIDDFADTEYWHQWSSLLRSPRLAELAHEHGKRVTFLAHPNIVGALPKVTIPTHVSVETYAGSDPRRLFADSAVMVTDYSSVAFDAAYLERPVVYFQFDPQRVLEGGHIGRAGYFGYATHGYGPVCPDVAGVLREVERIADRGWVPDAPYQERIDRSFPLRDGKCSQRTIEAIRSVVG